MKLIVSAKELSKEFKRLMNQYSNYYWATAWASHNCPMFDLLLSNQNKTKIITVGIHFYQTSPEFIEAFVDSEDVRFIQQPEGTFHPKIYLFANDSCDKWELIVGSSNFTHAAFTRNTEANMLLNYNDDNAIDIWNNAVSIIKKSWKESKQFTQEDFENYRTICQNNQLKIKSLSGVYGLHTNKKNKQVKPIHQIGILTKSWDEFVEEVIDESYLESRINVLKIAGDLFKSVEHFCELDYNDRRYIAGFDESIGSDSVYFGSMKGNGYFKQYINNNNQYISEALDNIPLNGVITKSQYMKYIKLYESAVKSSGFIATATRLLCMKRPDIFLCLDSKNQTNLCKSFGIVSSKMTYERYWDDIIERIYDSNWWQSPIPDDETERIIWNGRVAFIDSLFYEE